MLVGNNTTTKLTEVTMNDKIKDLLSTAYKTDSIAKNKWRIENREQLREQRKKELKELMEKEITMSNNKQNTQQTNLNISNAPMVISQTTTTNTAQGYWVKHLKIKGGNNEQQ